MNSPNHRHTLTNCTSTRVNRLQLAVEKSRNKCSVKRKSENNKQRLPTTDL